MSDTTGGDMVGLYPSILKPIGRWMNENGAFESMKPGQIPLRVDDPIEGSVDTGQRLKAGNPTTVA